MTENGYLVCDRCAHRCRIANRTTGRCGVVLNSNGVLFETGGGVLSYSSVDVIESRPLFHFAPGSTVLVAGGYGCSFTCPYCQNHSASFSRPPDHIEKTKPAELVGMALESDARGIVCGIAEPLVLRDYFSDVCTAARDANLFTVMVSNGYATPETLERIIPLLDATVVGLKGFSESTYRRYCGGSLFHVLRSIEAMYSGNVHLELTYLLIPDVSTTGRQPIEFARWVSGLDRDIPVHYVAYHPDHLWSGRTAPSPSMVDSAVSAALENGLRYVYGHGGTREELNTACSGCGHVLIRRPVRRQGCPPDGLNRWCTGFDVRVDEKRGCCPSCGSPVPFVNLATPRG